MTQPINPQAQRRRVQYRANHRGTKEMDILLGSFADSALAEMSAGEMVLFEQMLGLPDPEIDNWIRRGEAPVLYSDLIHRIRNFHRF